MFESDAYIEVKRIIYQLIKAGEWHSLDPKIRKVYTDDLKYWQRRLGFPDDNTEKQSDSVLDMGDRKQTKKPDRKKYYEHPFSLEKAEAELGFIPISPFSVEDEVIQNETYQELHIAIDTLDDFDKYVIEKYYFEDMKERQIGQELGVVQKTVNNHKTDSLETMKEILTEKL